MRRMSNKNSRYLNDFEHLAPSSVDVLTTPIDSRVIYRDYGSNLFQLIDIPINRELFSRNQGTVAEAIDKWEPRFKVEKLTINEGRIIAHPQNFIGEFKYKNLSDLETPRTIEEILHSEFSAFRKRSVDQIDNHLLVVITCVLV